MLFSGIKRKVNYSTHVFNVSLDNGRPIKALSKIMAETFNVHAEHDHLLKSNVPALLLSTVQRWALIKKLVGQISKKTLWVVLVQKVYENPYVKGPNSAKGETFWIDFAEHHSLQVVIYINLSRFQIHKTRRYHFYWHIISITESYSFKDSFIHYIFKMLFCQ